MSKPKGYLIPETVNPLDNEYIIVSVPAHEGHRRAFWGAMQRLGYWWAWERDTLKQGKDCAARWRESIAETMELWEDIGSMSPLTINMTCNSCCDQATGAAGSTIIINNVIHFGDSDYGAIIDLPGGQVDDGVNPPSTDWPDYAGYLQYKCNYALQFATDLIATTTAMAQFTSGVTELIYDQIELLFTRNALSALIKGSVAALFTTGTWLDQLRANLLTIAQDDPTKFVTLVDVAEAMDRDTIRCAIYSAGTADAARDAILAHWDQIFVDLGLGGNVIDDFTKYEFDAWFKLFIHILNLEPAFDLAQIAETFAGADCSDCVGVIPPNPPHPLLENLAAHWDLDVLVASQFADSRNDFYLGPDGALPALVPGLLGNAVEFLPGHDSNLRAAAAGHAALLLDSAVWSVSMWLRPGIPTNQGLAFSTTQNGLPAYGGAYLAIGSDSSLAFVMFNTSGNEIWNVYGEDILFGAPYHVCFGVSNMGETIQWMQVNGNPRSTVQASFAYKTNTRAVTLGNRYENYSTVGAYVGVIDHVDIWKGRKLSEADVIALYNLGAPLPYTSYT